MYSCKRCGVKARRHTIKAKHGDAECMKVMQEELAEMKRGNVVASQRR